MTMFHRPKKAHPYREILRVGGTVLSVEELHIYEVKRMTCIHHIWRVFVLRLQLTSILGRPLVRLFATGGTVPDQIIEGRREGAAQVQYCPSLVPLDLGGQA